MLKEGIRRRDIRILDGCLHLLQPHFLLISTFFVILSYVQMGLGYPLFTNIYQFLPSSLLTVITMGQYILPIIILAKIHVKWKAWFYLILYPVFIYSWIPICIFRIFR